MTDRREKPRIRNKLFLNYEQKGTPVQNRRRPEASTDVTGRMACYGRFSAVAKNWLQRNTDKTRRYERIRFKRPNTNFTDRDRERDKIEGEIEILSLFPLGFPPVVQQTIPTTKDFVSTVPQFFLERRSPGRYSVFVSTV